ncbi:hypothetical protein CMU59_17535 [Elizabethkingia anophelis]|uniref:hypothetical protein n=1 Tax=Elizabethkingia anophelis TaxID=1117645 RepID=UPI000C6CA42E|nr:hypothetical protein [Elizabethkingia anophelis]MCL1689668.1 hypothetical protein [Elizabethkingia anophelis]MDV3575096.1 hypothetical protein [Elizabethkingia anophelis]MDV3599387.1 hypothetical protein [Elizabethkingia anophelis]MDV3607049.1 hypothetical protein [Elizabethkingia anophelis]MDV3640447.1 hypothetical protein [Elizabethkingia anophelis]
MKFIKKIITNSKSIILIIIFTLSSCNKKPQIHFDIREQKIVECGDFAINNIYIINDSVNEKGFFIEPRIYLKWSPPNKAPFSISLSNIPTSYNIYKDNKIINNFKLMNNTSYTISQTVSGKSTFSIRIWTNEQGKIYKTSHNDCDNSASLDMK